MTTIILNSNTTSKYYPINKIIPIKPDAFLFFLNEIVGYYVSGFSTPNPQYYCINYERGIICEQIVPNEIETHFFSGNAVLRVVEDEMSAYSKQFLNNEVSAYLSHNYLLLCFLKTALKHDANVLFITMLSRFSVMFLSEKTGKLFTLFYGSEKNFDEPHRKEITYLKDTTGGSRR